MKAPVNVSHVHLTWFIVSRLKNVLFAQLLLHWLSMAAVLLVLKKLTII